MRAASLPVPMWSRSPLCLSWGRTVRTGWVCPPGSVSTCGRAGAVVWAPDPDRMRPEQW